MTVAERAPAKVNLVLHVGAPGPDGLHAVCSLFAALDLADDVVVEPIPGAAADELICPGVHGENLAGRALAAYRAVVPHLPPLRVTIAKRIPVAAGLGGGSADAAAALRAANVIAGGGIEASRLRALAAGLGSDVPSQVEPGHALVSDTGARVEPLALPRLELVLVPHERGLSTGAVYAELDRLRAAGLAPARPRLDPRSLRSLASAGPAELAVALENDLEPAALALRPELAGALAALHEAGALGARVTGSGPTAFGVFADRDSATAAARTIPGAILATVG